MNPCAANALALHKAMKQYGEKPTTFEAAMAWMNSSHKYKFLVTAIYLDLMGSQLDSH